MQNWRFERILNLKAPRAIGRIALAMFMKIVGQSGNSGTKKPDQVDLSARMVCTSYHSYIITKLRHRTGTSMHQRSVTKRNPLNNLNLLRGLPSLMNE